MAPDDGDLVRFAQAGDVTSLGILLERYRADLYAIALGILGAGPQAEDAVQDAFLLAVRGIGKLRDPQAAKGWLRSITRNVCYSQIRKGYEIPLGDELTDRLESCYPETTTEEYLHRLAVRDWVWTALAELPEALRVTAMLRYFGSYPSYNEIALILGVPVGTVKSRLNQAKIRLSAALLQTAQLEHSEMRAVTSYYTSQFAQVASMLNRGEMDWAFLTTIARDVTGIFGAVTFQGRQFYVDGLQGDIRDGVKLHPTNVLASHNVAVLEGTFENPPDDPQHCPPGMTSVFYLRDNVIQHMRILHTPRLGGPEA